ncbi:AcrR family transcriptional regulator/alkylhydroperoxidase family enzyme [Mycobacterium sp. MAA66]|uniref:TetR/AcrR family transcriptional regulator C-terminal ligand-binding domain-containing protein n=1 Tax=Mycobacterium sp. MAA66 TaxID=3156297 RepID=UPI0035119CF5
MALPARRTSGRSARVRSDVLAATTEILLEDGLDAATITAIAERSGVHHTSIYRRWGDRSALICDALRDAVDTAVPVRDIGDLREELTHVLEDVLSMYRSPLGPVLMDALRSRDPALEELRHGYFAARLESCAVIAQRAKARGELPEDADHRLVFEQLMGPILASALLGGDSVTSLHPGTVVHMVLDGATHPYPPSASRAPSITQPIADISPSRSPAGFNPRSLRSTIQRQNSSQLPQLHIDIATYEPERDPMLVPPALQALTDDQRAVYDRFPANLTQYLLLAEASAQPYLNLGMSFRYATLAPKDRETIILRVAGLLDNSYEAMQHKGIATSVGIDESVIDQLLTKHASFHDPRLAKIVAYVDAAVSNTIDPLTVETLTADFTNRQIAEIALLTGHYVMTSIFLRSLNVPLDSQPTAWGDAPQ